MKILGAVPPPPPFGQKKDRLPLHFADEDALFGIVFVRDFASYLYSHQKSTNGVIVGD